MTIDLCSHCRALIDASGRSLAEILLPTAHLMPGPEQDPVTAAMARAALEEARDRMRAGRLFDGIEHNGMPEALHA